MANPAINAAIIAAAQQQAAAAKAITDRLKQAGATSARAAIPLDLADKASGKMLDHLLKRGHVRATGGDRYWLDEQAIARGKAAATRVTLILLAFLLSAGASLIAILLSR